MNLDWHYTRLAFWMPDFSGVNQIGFNKVTWGIPMTISPSSSLRFLQAISPSHAPSLCVIHASFIWQQIASCSNMNADVAAGVDDFILRIQFFFRFSTVSSWEKTSREVFSGWEVYLVKCRCVFVNAGTYVYKKGGRSLLCCISKPKAWVRRHSPSFCVGSVVYQGNGVGERVKPTPYLIV